jgi:hypothetical protein
MQYVLRFSELLLAAILFTLAGPSFAERIPLWRADAARWPSPGTLTSPYPAEAQIRFMQLLHRTLNDQWLPGNDETIPYLRQWGFVFTHDTAQYHLQVREVMRPVYDGALSMTDGVVFQLDPKQGTMPLPTNRHEMLTLLKQFLNDDILLPATDPAYTQPTITVARNMVTYTQSNNLHFWTDGHVIRMAYEERPVYAYPKAAITAIRKNPQNGSLCRPLPDFTNPWLILAATGWPSSHATQGVAPTGEREHFALWTRNTLLPSWQPDALYAVPYLNSYGLVSDKTKSGYRVRIREATLNLPQPTRAILMAVEPLSGQLPFPTTHNAMMALLAKFVVPQVLAMPPLEQYPPESILAVGCYSYTRYHSESPDLPVNLCAWANAKLLLIVFIEDPPGDCPTCAL